MSGVNEATQKILNIMDKADEGSQNTIDGEEKEIVREEKVYPPVVEPQKENIEGEWNVENEENEENEENVEAVKANAPTSEKQEEAAEDNSIELDNLDIASFLGVDEADIKIDEEGKLRFQTKIDGEVDTKTLKDLKDGYQLAKTSQQRLQKLAEDRKQLELERQEWIDNITKQHQFLDYTLSRLTNDFANDFKNTNWDKIKEEEGLEGYLAKRSEYEDRARHIDNYKNEYLQARNKMAQEQSALIQQAWQEGFRKLQDEFSGPAYSSTPKWDNSEQEKLLSWMQNKGYSKRDISQVNSWLVFKWARDSMLRENEQEKAKESIKKIRKVPKIKTAKPGGSTPPSRKSDIEMLKDKQRKASKLGNSPLSRRSNMKETQDLLRKILS